MNISVTKNDIANGKRRSFTRCPIALACKRRAKTDGVDVNFQEIRIGDRFFYPVEEFMSDFDSGRPVKPSRFTLEEFLSDH